MVTGIPSSNINQLNLSQLHLSVSQASLTQLSFCWNEMLEGRPLAQCVQLLLKEKGIRHQVILRTQDAKCERLVWTTENTNR